MEEKLYMNKTNSSYLQANHWKLLIDKQSSPTCEALILETLVVVEVCGQLRNQD